MASSLDRGVAESTLPSTVGGGLGQCHDRSLRRSATWAMSTTRAAERHIVRRACVLIVELERSNAGSPERRGTPSSPAPVGGLSVDTTLISMRPRGAAAQRNDAERRQHHLRPRCGRRSPSGTAASWNPNYTGYEVTRMSDVSNIEIKVVSANDVPLGR